MKYETVEDIKTDEELARWFALMDAVELVADKCKIMGENFDDINLEPLYIKKYVDDTHKTYYKKIQAHKENQIKLDLIMNQWLKFFENTENPINALTQDDVY